MPLHGQIITPRDLIPHAYHFLQLPTPPSTGYSATRDVMRKTNKKREEKKMPLCKKTETPYTIFNARYGTHGREWSLGLAMKMGNLCFREPPATMMMMPLCIRTHTRTHTRTRVRVSSRDSQMRQAQVKTEVKSHLQK